MSSALSDPGGDQKVKAVMPGNHFLLISFVLDPAASQTRKIIFRKNGGYQVTVLSFAWSVVLHSEAPGYTKS